MHIRVLEGGEEKLDTSTYSTWNRSRGRLCTVIVRYAHRISNDLSRLQKWGMVNKSTEKSDYGCLKRTKCLFFGGEEGSHESWFRPLSVSFLFGQWCIPYSSAVRADYNGRRYRSPTSVVSSCGGILSISSYRHIIVKGDEHLEHDSVLTRAPLGTDGEWSSRRHDTLGFLLY